MQNIIFPVYHSGTYTSFDANSIDCLAVKMEKQVMQLILLPAHLIKC